MSVTAPNDFVDVPITVDPAQLADAAIASLQEVWPDYVPNEGNLEVALIEVFSAIAAQAAVVAAQVPLAALTQFGVQLLGLAMASGSQATATATFTMVDSSGYTLYAGQQVSLGGVAFALQETVTIPAGQTTGTGTLVCALVGSFANGLTATDWASLTLTAGVIGLSLSAPTSEGSDPQTAEQFVSYIAQYLQLRARSIITLQDFETEALLQLTSDIGGGRVNATASGSHPRNITLTCTDDNGLALSSGEIANVLAAVSAPNTRMVNAEISVVNANYCQISVGYAATSLPNVDPTSLETLINSALTNYLNPAAWGAPPSGDQQAGLTWINMPTVHVNKLIALAGAATGCDYISSLMIYGGQTELTTALVQGAATTTLNVQPLPAALASGTVIYLVDPTGTYADAPALTAAAAVGATTLSVSSFHPVTSYPVGSWVSIPITGDFTMPGASPLPLPGVMSGVISTPST